MDCGQVLLVLVGFIHFVTLPGLSIVLSKCRLGEILKHKSLSKSLLNKSL